MKNSDAKLAELRLLARERHRQANLECAGLFLQQQIGSDLAENGALAPDEYVEITRDESGKLIAVVRKT